MTAVEDALDGLSARDAAALVVRLTRRLQTCVICSADGAIACRLTAKAPTGQRGTIRATFMVCVACLERHRLTERLSEGSSGGSLPLLRR